MSTSLLDRPETAREPRSPDCLADLMPYAQTLLFRPRGVLMAEDGERLRCFAHAWTRRRVLVADDGRLYWRREGRIVPCPRSDAHLRAVLPGGREWLALGGYERGDLLGPPVRAEGLTL